MHISTGPVVTRSGGDAPYPVTLGDPILFLDNTLLSYAEGVERLWHFPEKLPQPVMKATKPWEIFGKYRCVGGFSGKSFVVKDDKIMMFYSIYHMGPGPEFRSFAYAESRDGVKWTKPDLGNGTNLLIQNKPRPDGKGPVYPYYEMQNVLWDERSGLYRAMGHCALSKGKSGTFYASSKDPTKWDPKTFRYAYKNEDIHALLGWDENAKAYVSYPRVQVWRGGMKRAIGYSVSKDFKKWSDPVVCHQPHAFDSPGYQIYNMPVERIGPQVIAFPIGYRPSPIGVGPLDTEFAFSYGGATFEQPFGHIPYIPRGLPGEWDDCYVMAAAPIVWQGRTLIYYWGCNFPHDTGFREEKVDEGSVGLATLPENRYAGLSCPRHYRGMVETDFLKAPEARALYLNCDTSRGKITIYVGEKVVASVCERNSTDELVILSKSLPLSFKLRFEIMDAELFGFTLTK